MTNLAKRIFWDYKMTEQKMRYLLSNGSDWEKRWVAGRILERAPFNDVWKFLTLKQVEEMFPLLKFRPQIREIWAKALEVWTKNDKDS